MEKVKNNHPEINNYNIEPKHSFIMTTSAILIIMLMVSIAFAFHFLGNRLILGWKGSYLIFIAVLLSLESMYSRKKVREFETKEKVIYRVSEWVAFAVIIKIVLYLVHDPAQFIADLPKWQEDFLQNFFTGEYLIAIILAVIVWWSSSTFISEIEELYEQELNPDWDDLGKLQNTLHEIRNRISAKIFIIGTLVVGLSVASRLEVSVELLNNQNFTEKPLSPVINTVFYFVIALILLTQTQFALLRTRWQSQHLPVSTNLTRNWVRYGLIFFLLLAVIVVFLPTNYTIGFLETLKIAFSYLVQGLSLVIFILMLPITFCLSLFKIANQGTGTTNGTGSFRPPEVTPSEPLAWWEFLKSLLFWLFFIGIIFFAVRYYLLQNTSLMNSLKKFPVFSWIASFWKGFAIWLKGANSQIKGLIKSSLQRVSKQVVRLPSSPFNRFVNLSKMKPRDKIIYYYSNIVQIGSDKGIVRKPSETPYHYQNTVSSVIPEINPDLSTLTDEFIEARYSQHEIYETNAVIAGNKWEQIKVFFQYWKRSDDRK